MKYGAGEGGTNLVWLPAKDIEMHLYNTGSTILVRQEVESKNGWWGEEVNFSIKKIGDLKGLALDVFLKGGYEWILLEEEKSWWEQVPDQRREYKIFTTASGFSEFTAEIARFGVISAIRNNKIT